MRTEDGYIIRKCLNGDWTAFGFLVDKYKESVYAFVYARVRNFHDAEDVTQEVFIKAYQKLRTLKRQDSFLAWLYSIASNHCKMWLRSRSRRPDGEFAEDKNPEILEAPSIDSYRDKLARESLRDALDEALDSLPDTYREVLTLHYLGGMSGKEIARFLGTSPAAIKQRLMRARSQLKEETLAMMNITFEQRKLPAGFTFRIVETVKRIKIQPMPRVTGLPWGLSLAAGIIFTVLTLNPNINLVDPADIPMAPMSFRETEMAQVGEIHVDILKLSQIPAISGKQGNDNRGDPGLLQEQNALLLAPRGEEGEFPEEPTARLGKGTIRQVAYSPDGKLVAAAGSLGIWLYDADNLNEVGLLEGHTTEVMCLVFSPDGEILASGDSGRTTRLWDVQAQKEIWLIQQGATSVAFSLDGRTLARGGSDITLWDVQTQEQVGMYASGASSVAFSPDGKILASGGWDQTVRLWNAQTQEQIVVLPGHTANVMSIGFNPGGKTLASGGGWGDQAVRLWDVAEQRQLKVLKEHSGIVWSVAFSPNGKILASCSLGEDVDGVGFGEIRLWDLATQKQVGMITPEADDVRALAFSPDGKFLASGGSGDCAVRIWDVGEQIASGNSREVAILYGHTGWVEDIAFSPGGRWLASGSQDGTVLIWEVNLPGGPRPVEPEGKLPGRWGEIKKTKLLQNFPNPFNPETWMPFRLAEASDVTIRIYQQSGQLTRTLNLGRKEEGIYLEKSRAGYWDGINDTGESVASGVFYTLETGGFSQTRKMTVLR